MNNKNRLVCIFAVFLITSCDMGEKAGTTGESTLDASTLAYLEEVFARVKSGMSPADRLPDVKLIVVADGALLARSTTGEVTVSSGMLYLIRNEAELACLFAHELSHHVLGHVNEGKPDSTAYSSSSELAADAMALPLCASVGYSPIAFIDLLQRVSQLFDAQTEERSEPIHDRIKAGLSVIGTINLDRETNYYVARYYENTEELDQLNSSAMEQSPGEAANFFNPLDPQDVTIPVRCAALIRDTSLGDKPLMDEVKDASKEWMKNECSNEHIDGVPTNYYDAFGHCYFACRAEEYGEGCADLGLAREELREAGAWLDSEYPDLAADLRGAPVIGKEMANLIHEHDSYEQDVSNNRIGAGPRSDGGDCYDSCANAAHSGLLDFSAPQRAFFPCESLDKEAARRASDDLYELKMTGDCQYNLRPSTHRLRNHTSEPFEYHAQTEGDTTEATINNNGTLKPMETVDIQVNGVCICQCGSPSAGMDKLVIRTRPVGSDTNILYGKIFEEVPIKISCSAVPESCGGSSGEPHIATIGKLAFDFQAAGEFVLARTGDGLFEVQTRQRPWPRGNSVTLNSAVAVGIAEHRVGVYHTSGDPMVLVNGKGVELQNFEKRELGNDGSVQRFGLTFVIQDNVGRSAVVKAYRNNLNVFVHVPPNTEIAGLLGGGESENLPALRDGGIIDSPVLHEQLYGEFADSWALRQEESLFDYAGGRGPEDFRDKRIPIGRFTVDNLSVAQRKHGEAVCGAAGVTNPIEFENCTLDVGFTGDASFADPAFSADYPLRALEIGFAPTTSQSNSAAGRATLSFPTSAAAGSSISVQWTGPANYRDYISIARKEQLSGHYLVYGYLAEDSDTVTLRVPGIPGNYEIRYVIDTDSQVIASAPLDVTPVTATLVSPTQAGAGSSISVQWTGPANYRDYISIARKEQLSGHYLVYSYLAEDSDTVTLRVPGIPGNYEIRYVIDTDSQVIASAPLDVTPVTATLDAPDTADVDSTVSIKWTGPANYRDYISIARKEQLASHYVVYSYLDEDTDTVSLKTPGEPGQYVIRYVIDSDSQIVASIPITIEPKR